MKCTWIVALVLALLAATVSAQVTEDFSVAHEQAFTAAQGTSVDSYFQVTNTGSIASQYAISVADSDVASWVKMGPLGFILQPGQSQVVLLHIDVPSDAEPDTYTLQTIFTTVSGTTTAIEQDIEVTVPQNVLLQSVPDKTIPACGSASYPITVFNTGTFRETYDLTVSKNVVSFATFAGNHVSLDVGKNTTVQLTLAPTDCTQSGVIDFTVTGTAASTKSQTFLGLTLDIENTFIPTIEITGKRVNTDVNTLNATITNTGDAKATYALKIVGADFVSVTPSITLDTGQKGTVQVVSRPKSDVVQKPYELNLTASVDKAVYSTPFILTVKNPTWFEQHLWFLFKMALFAIILIIIAVIAIGRWVTYTQTPEYQEHKAEREKEKAAEQKKREADKAAAQKEKEKAERERIREEEREAAKKQRDREKMESRLAKERAEAAKEAAAELKATHVLISRESLQGDAVLQRSKSMWWIALILIILAVGVLAYGFRTYLQANIDAVITGGTALIIVIALLILYRVFFSAKTATQEWVALKPRRENQLETGWRSGVGQLWLRVNELLPNAKLTVTGTRTNPAFVAPEGDVYQYITLTPEGITSEQVEKQRIMFRVARSWLKRHEISEGGVKLMRYTADGWKGIGTDKVRSDEKWVYYQASYAGFEPFAIVGKSRIEKKLITGLAPGWWFLILGIIILAALFGGIWYLATAGQQGTAPVGAPTTSGIPAQVWNEDTQHLIDLGKYFKDPDSDLLHYSYTPVPNIVITISGNIATLMPEKDWSGTRTVTFTADDGKGGKVNSNPVSLTVVEIPEPTFWGNFRAGVEKYSGYIVLGIILLVILIVLLEYRKSFKSR